jgi:hypothetical protein
LSYEIIERRYTSRELEVLLKALNECFEKVSYEKSRRLTSLCINNLDEFRKVINKIKTYDDRLNEFKAVLDSINIFKNIKMMDSHISNNELYLKSEIGIILLVKEYKLILFYLNQCDILRCHRTDSILLKLIRTVEEEIAKKAAHEYLCKISIEN